MTVKELVELLKDMPQDHEVILDVEEYWRPLKRVESFVTPSREFLVTLSDNGDQ